jgi:contractile injection system tube protein
MDAISAAKLPFNLKIIPVNSDGIPAGIPFIAMFNPDSFTIKEDVKWENKCAPGNEGEDPVYKATRARSFTLEFTLDGTGVNTNGVKIPVTLQVLLFRTATTKLIGSTHRPPYLLVQYGTFISSCNIDSSNVTYTMFDMFGLPIRAKISASFTERTPSGLGALLSMLSSPDLTHKVEVKEGDILPLLTYKTYNNQNYYLQVAKVNKLKNFRKLKAGTTLVFPPISDK